MNILKSFLLIIAVTLLFVSCGPKFEGTFSTSPEKPTAGQEITVMFDPAGTVLEGKESIDMNVYLYSVDLDDAVGVEMKKEGKGFIASFSTLPSTKGVIVKFVDSDDNEIEETNSGQGYLLSIYDESGKAVAGSKAGLANAYYRWGSSAGLERDGNKSVAMFEEAFAENPSIKIEYLEPYFNVLQRVNPDEASNIIAKELTAIEQKTDFTEDELGLLASWYSNIDNQEKAEMFKAKVLEKYPSGNFAEENDFNEYDNESDVSEKINLLTSFQTKYPNSKKLPNMFNDVLYTLAKAEKFEDAYKFVMEHPAQIHPAYYHYALNKMISGNADPKLAMSFAEESVKQAKNNFENPYLEKPNSSTIKEWKNSGAYYVGLNEFRYGQLLYDSGSVPKTIGVLESAIENTDKLYSEQDLKDYYANVLVEAGENKKALEKISGFIEKGHGSSALQANLKKAFVAENGSEEGFDTYLSKFVSAAEAEMLVELKTHMINDAAPAFSLQDLEGNTVSLSDYKGKTVIVDFWATWCGPCLNSFPGMKMAVEKFQNDDSVVFLFVNTWERVDNKLENATNFISENNYPFHVLMDLNNEVITEYKVEGIPTKFIIGPDQNIKFKSVGFSGNIDQLAKEVEMMIGLAKG